MSDSDFQMLSKSLGLPPSRLKRMGFSLLKVSERPVKVLKEVCFILSFATERPVTND